MQRREDQWRKLPKLIVYYIFQDWEKPLRGFDGTIMNARWGILPEPEFSFSWRSSFKTFYCFRSRQAGGFEIGQLCVQASE